MEFFNIIQLYLLCVYFLCFLFETFCVSPYVALIRSDSYRAHLYKSFIGISIKVCRAECDKRQRCVSALYNRKFLLCQLSSTDVLQNVIPWYIREHVLIGVSVIKSTTSPCEPNYCTHKETCEVTQNWSSCRVTECTFPGSPYVEMFGNVFDVGSWLMIKDDTSKKNLTIQCGDDGAWFSYERQTQDCSDVHTTETGVYWQTSISAPVFCDMENNGGRWLVFQRRQDGSVDFYRNWDNYTTGFGNISGEFWMGLNSIDSILSTGSYELRIDLEDFSGEQRYATYDQFKLKGPEENFRIFFSDYAGDAGDGMTYGINMSFTTKDQDNDLSPSSNCAKSYKGGWWYNSCHRANLNGLYHRGRDVTYSHYIHWEPWTGYFESLKRTDMKIRRIG